ncbi:MAG: glycoside hydrolase family 3 C-terminal domain-containing protein [Mobilitalea sp.]
MRAEMNNKSSLKEEAKNLVAKMTLEEKASLCSGKDCWNTKAIARLGIESIMMSDGPHGLRKQIDATDNLGIGASVPATCYPTASAIACSFDRELVYEVGAAMGEACLQEQVSVILGPGANQKRNPLCGRNFEYFSEDPLLSGEMAASMIRGIQSTGISTSLKHFAVNNQEKRRMTINAVVDERALRETYLKAFEIAVKKGNPDTVMCSYNRLNGEYTSENTYLLTDILRNEWGFDNAVISDWGAVHDRAFGVTAGLDIEMPGNNGFNDKKLVAAVRNRSLSEEALDIAATNVCKLILKGMRNKRPEYQYDKELHHQLAVKALEESAVLLKNDGMLLPGNLQQKAAVIGAFAKTPRYQGAGSSKINPINIENSWDVLVELGVDVSYAKGYSLDIKGNKAEEVRLIREACEAVKDKDIVYLFAGLPEGYESEGFDRTSLELPEAQNKLIEAVSEYNSNLVVILIGGAPVVLPWIDKVKSILLAYLGGEGVGRAIVNLLLGVKVPCGKLAETWPLKLEDTPCYNYYPGGRLISEYRESIFVGYRYYEKAQKPVLFPFGHGLSYADFTYSDLKLERKTCNYGESFSMSFHLTNNSNRMAKETAFIFAAHESEVVILPQKELRDFIKIELMPGETKEITLTLDTSTFSYYNTMIKDWYCESGDYNIMVCTSSNVCALKECIHIISPIKPQPNYTLSAPSYYQLSNKMFEVDKREFEAMYGSALPVDSQKAKRPYGPENTLEDVNHTLIGKVILMYADRMARKVAKVEKEQEGMISAAIKEMPFFAMAANGEGGLPENVMEGILEILNGHYLKGIRRLL